MERAAVAEELDDLHLPVAQELTYLTESYESLYIDPNGPIGNDFEALGFDNSTADYGNLLGFELGSTGQPVPSHYNPDPGHHGTTALALDAVLPFLTDISYMPGGFPTTAYESSNIGYSSIQSPRAQQTAPVHVENA
jgi:hypothetical protein